MDDAINFIKVNFLFFFFSINNNEISVEHQKIGQVNKTFFCCCRFRSFNVFSLVFFFFEKKRKFGIKLIEF
jgi:hypothetical protein